MEPNDDVKNEDKCNYCGREARFHSEKWILCHSDQRPVEEDSADVAYGKHRLVVRHIERKDEVVVWAGTRIDEVICQSCWDNGKRFKDFRPE